MLGRDGSEISAVGSFLEADELLEALPLVGDLERQLKEGFHSGVGLVGHHTPALVENTAQAAQQQQVALRLLPVPGIDDHRTGAGDQPAFQSAPDAGGMRLVGHNLVDTLREERLGLPGTDQRFGKRPQRVGVEEGRQKPVERFIVSENQHRRQKRVSCPSLLSVFRRCGAVSRRRTCSGRSSFTPCPMVSSRQQMKYCAFFITTPICRSDCCVSAR